MTVGQFLRSKPLLLALYFLTVLAVSICWIILDIGLSFVEPFNGPHQSGLQTLSWGSINIAINFFVYAMICVKLFPDNLPTNEKLNIMILGAAIRIVATLFIRLPLYLKYHKYPNSDVQTLFGDWLFHDPTGGYFAVFGCVAIRYILEFWFLPYYVGLKTLKYSSVNSENKKASNFKLLNSKLQINSGLKVKDVEKIIDAPQKTFINFVTFGWTAFWCFGIILVASLPNIGNTNLPVVMDLYLYAVLWIPLVICILFLARDYHVATKIAKSPLRHSLAYIGLFLWLIEMMPEFSSNIINVSFNLKSFVGAGNIRLLGSIFYTIITFIIKNVGTKVLVVAGHGQPIFRQLIFPIQYFKVFFELFFFIQLEVTSWIFWAIVLLQVGLNTVEEIYGFERILHSILKFLRHIFGMPSLVEDIDEVEGMKKERFFIRGQVLEAFQQMLADIISISALLTTYYVYIDFLRVNEGFEAARKYSSDFFGIGDFVNHFNFLAIQSGVVLLIRSLGHLIAFHNLSKEATEFNRKLVAGQNPRQSLIESRNLLNDVDAIRSIDDIPRIRFMHLLYQQLEGDWWIFFVFTSLALTRVGFLCRTVLYEVEHYNIDYWSRNIYKRLLTG